MRLGQLWGRGFATLAGVLLIATQALAHSPGPNFRQAVDLGATTEWPTTGVRSEPTDIPDVDGYGANYFKLRVAEHGQVLVWTSGGLSPLIQVFDHAEMPVGSEDRSRRAVVLDAGVNYVRARSSSTGRYRLHVAGGGRGHDDIGNTVAQAAPLPSCRGLASDDSTECRPSSQTVCLPNSTRDEDVPNRCWSGNDTLELPARLDYERDRDWYRFDVPQGPPVPVRIWSSGTTNTQALLYDDADVLLERDNYGLNGNFFIDRALDPGTYFVVVSHWSDSTGPYRLHLAGRDDHGNFIETATQVRLPNNGTAGGVDYSGDRDLFSFRVTTPGRVTIRTTGTPTYGNLYDSFNIGLADDWLHSSVGITTTLARGTYYVRVRHGESRTGPYTLHLSGDASGVLTVPLLPADGNARGQQGFVRVTNHSDQRAEVEITAVDDTGMRRTLSSPLPLAPWQTRHFNSGDLERGNPAKGIASGGVGDGTGNWYLEVAPSRPEVEVLSYIRTEDGFLTSMHTQAPTYGRTHRVATFNPGRNRNQASRLRLINLKCPSLDPCDPANVTIYGVDDAGKRSPNVRLTVADGAAREVTAAELEGLDAAEGLDGTIGGGSGKWQLFVTADRPIQVMSLLESVSGHLTNLSAPASRQVFSVPEGQE